MQFAIGDESVAKAKGNMRICNQRKDLICFTGDKG